MRNRQRSIESILFLLIILVAFGGTPAGATTVVLQPSSQDAYLLQNAPNRVAGSGPLNTRIRVAPSPANAVWRGLVQFDLSGIPQFATINSATLELYERNNPMAARTHGVYLATAGWLQSTVKWNTQPTNQTSATVTAAVGTSVGFKSYVVTGDIQAFIDAPTTNHGWKIKDSAESSGNDQVNYVAREESDVHEVGFRPRLTVDFTAPPCSVNADCADTNPCTINERCQAGHCVVDPRNCDDNDACTDDICDPQQGCVNVVGECNDGFSCTIDGCDAQLGCTHTPVETVCQAEGCREGTCVADPDNTSVDPVTGCIFTATMPANTPCVSDGNICTDDICDGAGTCTHPNNTAPCGDGIFCNGVDTCSGGSCTHPGDPCADGPECTSACNEADDICAVATGTPCTDDGNVCTDDVCDGSGACTHPNNTASCDDGLFCTGVDTCSGGICTHTNDPCVGGAECNNVCNEAADNCAVATGTPCTDDGNVCTDDECNAGGCGHPNNAGPCDDGLFCTGTDSCSGGSCVVHTNDPCTSGPECNNVCNEAADNCLVSAGTGCTDDGNVCTDDTCDGAGACTHPNNSAPCDDGLFCTGVDTCGGGTCTHTDDPCVGGAECNNVCNEAADNCLVSAGTGCTDEGNVCTDDECNGAGACTHPNNSGPCDDGFFCTVGDSCSGGSCQGTPRDCNAVGDQCNNGVCDEDINQCVGPPKPNGTACNDANPCTSPDTCTAGECDGPFNHIVGCLDHFTCYKIKTTAGTPKFVSVPGVSLVDQFGSSTIAVKRPKLLCAPTNKNGEDPTAPSHPDHLEDYQIKPPRVFAALLNQRVVDQFNPTGLIVDLKKPFALRVPTAKTRPPTLPPAAPTNPAVDHFQCYKAKLPKGAPRFSPIVGVTIQDQFGTMTVDVKRPTRLCAPANKRNEDPGAENHLEHLMCYRVKQTSLPKFVTVTPTFVADQFGSETLDVKKLAELCVPALKNP